MTIKRRIIEKAGNGDEKYVGKGVDKNSEYGEGRRT